MPTVPTSNEQPTRAASLRQSPGVSTRLTELAGTLAGGALLASALIVSTDILLRWGISRPIRGLFEIMELVFACIVALSFAFANKKRMHVSMELAGNLTGRFRGVQLYADALTTLNFAFYTYFLFHHAGQKTLYGETTLVLGVPIGPVWYLAAGLLTLGLLAQLSALSESATALWRSPSDWPSELAAPAASLAAASVAALFLIWTADDQGALVKVLLGFSILYFLALAHVPIGVSMGLTGLVGCYAVLDIGAAQLIGANNLSSTISSPDLAAVPLFLLMGNLAIASGFADDIFEAATAIFGRMRGGHALATVLGCAGFGAISGSSVATTATLGGVAFREMKERSYADSLATGSIAAGGTLGALIPPSVILIIYCVIAELSISEAFAAALIPGLLALTLYTIAVMILVRLRAVSGTTTGQILAFRAAQGRETGVAANSFVCLRSGRVVWRDFHCSGGCGRRHRVCLYVLAAIRSGLGCRADRGDQTGCRYCGRVVPADCGGQHFWRLSEPCRRHHGNPVNHRPGNHARLADPEHSCHHVSGAGQRV